MRIQNLLRPVLFAAICLLAGCLARPHLDKQSFIFALPPSTAKVTSGNRVLGIRTLQVAAPFAGRAFVYRTGESSYDRDPYAEFMVYPAEGLASTIREWFRQSGGFGAVVEAGSGVKPNTLVEIHVTRLYGDFRQLEKPAAVLALHVVFFDAPDGVPGKVILQQDYSREIPLKARTADALVGGWNEALTQILDSIMPDLARAEGTSSKL